MSLRERRLQDVHRGEVQRSLKSAQKSPSVRTFHGQVGRPRTVRANKQLIWS
jgi:hypothetical protein